MKLADDDFRLFDIPQAFNLDPALLDQRWRALQRQVHPDRFAAEADAAQRVAMQWAVRVNEAYRRLKDPLKRAAYLCELRGSPIEAESNTAMPSTFLQKQMAWREALDDADGEVQVQSLAQDVADTEAELTRSLHQLLDVQQDAAAAAAKVRALMFVSRFRSDVEDRLEALTP
ncbi:MAG: Fe-S protein assembly co-chaperone HscB [Rubrivivax sp.]